MEKPKSLVNCCDDGSRHFRVFPHNDPSRPLKAWHSRLELKCAPNFDECALESTGAWRHFHIKGKLLEGVRTIVENVFGAVQRRVCKKCEVIVRNALKLFEWLQ